MYSIGYATKDIDLYINQLKNYGINVVADIRSVPYSKAFHDYHQEVLKSTLKKQNIRYVYLGAELGPRSKDMAHYENGQVQFDRLMQSQLFSDGVTRLFNGIDKGYNIALSCAEKDPAICHRSLLVAWYLLRHHSVDMQHILHNGDVELQSELEKRLLTETDTVPDMLMSEDEALLLAYQKQCDKFAYKVPTD